MVSPQGKPRLPQPHEGTQLLLLSRGVQKAGVGVGVTHLLALDARQPREPRFALRTPVRSHTQHPCSPGGTREPPRHGMGESRPPVLTGSPGAGSPWSPSVGPRSSAARTRASQDRQESPCEGREGTGLRGGRGCTPSRWVGRRDGHSPSPLSSLGCQRLPGEEKEELGWVLPGRAECHLVSPNSNWG